MFPHFTGQGRLSPSRAGLRIANPGILTPISLPIGNALLHDLCSIVDCFMKKKKKNAVTFLDRRVDGVVSAGGLSVAGARIAPANAVPVNLRPFCLFAHIPLYFLKRDMPGVVLMPHC